MTTKMINIVVPLNWTAPEIMNTLNAEENAFILNTGSEMIKEARSLVVGLSQTDIYNKIREESKSEIQKVNGVAISNIIGGRSQEVSVVLDKDKLAENKLDILAVAQLIQASNIQSNSGVITNNDSEISIHTGDFLKSAEDIENLIVGVNENRPIYLNQVAQVTYGAETAKNYVLNRSALDC